ncbi:glycoside hydrolase family 3 N-terminal domain-containing protein [uncultured Desulfovibrio sp.]|uniref:glycoside hydrolase family 3 N-terminal domain-containing protein n=1 Tax=uncultured Desulfovibrio sp. TaxID=167968 RepID=UPI00262D8A29|nr:glycoside hydrolase family 3 N-terminal domain-containing protein [uncultured Desulfovibrio sp.]
MAVLVICLSAVTVLGGEVAPAGGTPPALPSLDRMLGSMLMCGFRGTELDPDDPFLAAVADGRVGNVILFDRDMTTGGERNIRSPEQVRRLTATLRAAAPGPIFIAVDQEGGQVRRLRPQKGFSDLPSAQRLGQGSVAATLETATLLGEELAGLGIDVDLAPVADVDSNPLNPAIGRLGRAFSSDPAAVARHALAFGQGLARSGVIPVLKHFPGQGCAREDSHLGLPDITRCWDGATDLLPYAEIFRAGWPGMVMPGHLFHAGLDPDLPATLSRMVVTGLLRQGLGWQGVVISDDMQMRAIAGRYGLKESILLAVRAGVDILLYGNNLEWEDGLADKVFAALRALVDEGSIPVERIRRSWERISALHALSPTATTSSPSERIP